MEQSGSRSNSNDEDLFSFLTVMQRTCGGFALPLIRNYNSPTWSRAKQNWLALDVEK